MTDTTLDETASAELERHAVASDVAKAAGLVHTPDGRGFLLPWPDVDGNWHNIPRLYPHARTGAPGERKVNWPPASTGLKPVRQGTGKRVIVTEGYMQCLSVASWAPPEFSVLGMNGCDGIHKKTPLGWAAGAEVFLVFDADRRSNPRVRDAAGRVAGHLTSAGAASVRLVDVPGSGSDGIDDVLARVDPQHRGPFLAGLLAAAGSADDAPGEDAKLAAEIERQRIQREARRQLDTAERPPAELPEVLTLAQRLERQPEPVPWRVEGWQPEGSRVVLAAPMKAGKTTLVGNLVRVLVDGGPFLGRDRVTPVAGNVVVLDFEMSGHQLDTWLRDQKIASADRVVVVPMRGRAGAFDILDPAGRARWVELLAERQAAYVVLDCLRPVLDALGLDEHHDAGRFLVAFDALLSESGAAEACVVHHMGHTAERSRGDSRIRDWPDVEWRLVKQDADNPAGPSFLAAFGRDVDQPEQQLTYDPATRHLTLVGGSRRDAKTTADLDAVITYIRAHSDPADRSQRRIRVGSGVPERRTLAALKYGVEAGLLTWQPVQGGGHLYSLVEGTSVQVVQGGAEVVQTPGAGVVVHPIGVHHRTTPVNRGNPAPTTAPDDSKFAPPPAPRSPDGRPAW